MIIKIWEILSSDNRNIFLVSAVFSFEYFSLLCVRGARRTRSPDNCMRTNWHYCQRKYSNMPSSEFRSNLWSTRRDERTEYSRCRWWKKCLADTQRQRQHWPCSWLMPTIWCWDNGTTNGMHATISIIPMMMFNSCLAMVFGRCWTCALPYARTQCNVFSVFHFMQKFLEEVFSFIRNIIRFIIMPCLFTCNYIALTSFSSECEWCVVTCDSLEANPMVFWLWQLKFINGQWPSTIYYSASFSATNHSTSTALAIFTGAIIVGCCGCR